MSKSSVNQFSQSRQAKRLLEPNELVERSSSGCLHLKLYRTYSLMTLLRNRISHWPFIYANYKTNLVKTQLKGAWRLTNFVQPPPPTSIPLNTNHLNYRNFYSDHNYYYYYYDYHYQHWVYCGIYDSYDYCYRSDWWASILWLLLQQLERIRLLLKPLDRREYHTSETTMRILLVKSQRRDWWYKDYDTDNDEGIKNASIKR